MEAVLKFRVWASPGSAPVDHLNAARPGEGRAQFLHLSIGDSRTAQADLISIARPAGDVPWHRSPQAGLGQRLACDKYSINNCHRRFQS